MDDSERVSRAQQLLILASMHIPIVCMRQGLDTLHSQSSTLFLGESIMSNVSIAHTVVPFKAGDKPLTGQRLAKVGYKPSKNNPAKYPSVAVSVPPIAVQAIHDNLTVLLPFIGTLLEDTQDKVIRSLYEAADGKLSHVTDDDISVRACIAYLSAERDGNRLTNEAIESWFDSVLSENLQAYIAEKLGFEDPNADQMKVVEKHTRIYRELLSSLAGGKTLLAEKQIKGCKNALALCDDDGMSDRLLKRLESMEKKATEDFLDL
jgi:hypothetical protein